LLVVFERFFCGSEWVEMLYGSKAVKPGIRFVYKRDQPFALVKVESKHIVSYKVGLIASILSKVRTIL
jgi:hypothetical protein